MNFVKGAVMGMVAGTIVGAMYSNTIMRMLNKGTREVTKLPEKSVFVKFVHIKTLFFCAIWYIIKYE